MNNPLETAGVFQVVNGCDYQPCFQVRLGAESHCVLFASIYTIKFALF
jgi:hypothetical protein